MKDAFLVACRVGLFSLLVCGVVYPLLTTATAQAIFPNAANGSFVTDDAGRTVGSRLIGQGFSKAGYFHPRPSAAGAHGYDAQASAGFNLGPTSKALRTRIGDEAEALLKENTGPVPADLVTASASGLDPDISPSAAEWQAVRVARARGVDAERVKALVLEFTRGPDLGFLGEARVNVVQLNLALDRRFGQLH